MAEANTVDVGFGIGSEPPFRSQQTTQSQGLAHPDDGDAETRGRLSEPAPFGERVVVDAADRVGKRHTTTTKTSASEPIPCLTTRCSYSPR